MNEPNLTTPDLEFSDNPVTNSNLTMSSTTENIDKGFSKNHFSKSLRLLSPNDFQHVFAKADKFGNRHWTFIVRPNNAPSPRMGLAISKKNLSKAVWRNRVKRLAREAFRQHREALNGYDIIVLGRHNMQHIDNETLTKSFNHLIRKIKRSGLKNNP